MTAGGVPGQQAIPSAMRAMPVTRASVTATPTSSSPSNSFVTSEGPISRARPVKASLTAAKISTLFIV